MGGDLGLGSHEVVAVMPARDIQVLTWFSCLDSTLSEKCERKVFASGNKVVNH